MTAAGRPRGFTLVEVLMSTAVFAIIAAALVGLYALGTRSADRSASHVQSLSRAQAALAMLEKDVLEACRITTVAGYAASGSALAMLQPRFDADGLLVASNDVVVYYFRGDRLLRDVRPGSGSSLTSVTGQLILDRATASPVFEYLKDQGTTLVSVAQASQAEVVRVHLEVEGSSAGDQDVQYFRGEYRLRNMR